MSSKKSKNQATPAPEVETTPVVETPAPADPEIDALVAELTAVETPAEPVKVEAPVSAPVEETPAPAPEPEPTVETAPTPAAAPEPAKISMTFDEKMAAFRELMGIVAEIDKVSKDNALAFKQQTLDLKVAIETMDNALKTIERRITIGMYPAGMMGDRIAQLGLLVEDFRHDYNQRVASVLWKEALLLEKKVEAPKPQQQAPVVSHKPVMPATDEALKKAETFVHKQHYAGEGDRKCANFAEWLSITYSTQLRDFGTQSDKKRAWLKQAILDLFQSKGIELTESVKDLARDQMFACMEHRKARHDVLAAREAKKQREADPNYVPPTPFDVEAAQKRQSQTLKPGKKSKRNGPDKSHNGEVHLSAKDSKDLEKEFLRSIDPDDPEMEGITIIS